VLDFKKTNDLKGLIHLFARHLKILLEFIGSYV